MPVLDADDKRRYLIIWSTLLALFLGALDALVMFAAMPTIIAELGGLHLYAWTYTAYFLIVFATVISGISFYMPCCP